MIRKFFLVLMALAVPGMLFLNAHQVFRYETYTREISRLEQEQSLWVEENKRIVSSIMIYSSPGRISSLAEESLGLTGVAPEDVVLLNVVGDAP